MSGCFYCRNHINDSFIDEKGWSYSCRYGLDTALIGDGPEFVASCPKGAVQYGFQIGGYYRHMWFEGDVPKLFSSRSRDGGCLEWHIEGDKDFPQNGETQFHLCDFLQLEEWVKFWGKELRRRGWVVDEEE